MKSQDENNSDVLDLATDIADFAEYTFAAGELTGTQLKKAITDTSELLKGVDELTSERANRGGLSA